MASTRISIYTTAIISNELLSLAKEFPEWPVHQVKMAVFRGSFAGAADDVGLSSSAVAKLISRLEARLGVRINRTTRHLALTAEKEIYLEHARDILCYY